MRKNEKSSFFSTITVSVIALLIAEAKAAKINRVMMTSNNYTTPGSFMNRNGLDSSKPFMSDSSLAFINNVEHDVIGVFINHPNIAKMFIDGIIKSLQLILIGVTNKKALVRIFLLKA